MPKPDMSIDITPATSSVGPVESGKSLTFWLALAAVLIVLEQVTKIYFELNFDYQERLNVLPFFGGCRRLATLVFYWLSIRRGDFYYFSAAFT